MKNMNDNEMTFKILNDDGTETECEILFTFESDETKKNYIVYTDNSVDEEGNTSVFASTFNLDEDGGVDKLLPIETEAEWEVIEYYLEKLQEEFDK